MHFCAVFFIGNFESMCKLCKNTKGYKLEIIITDYFSKVKQEYIRS